MTLSQMIGNLNDLLRNDPGDDELRARLRERLYTLECAQAEIETIERDFNGGLN
jgi:hypothetical protein